MAQNTARKQLSRTQKAIMIVPLALLSGAWTLSLAGFGSATAAGTDHDKRKLPDGTQVPSQAIEAPASVPQAGVIAPGVPRGTADAVVNGASTSGIPSAAVSAYQRAAQIINAADKGCHVPWELIAAIGRVESDHGRYGGNVLTAEGVSKPGIYGIALNGKNGTQAIQDTDGGVLDKDTVYDRAVGAMQFIPGTWSVVKVDADGDGKRNPQDIDDSSLATAVYLCSGNDDLGTRKGQEAGVFRYNHSKSYVDLVLRIMTAYQSGDYTAVPTGASGGSVFSPSSSTTMRFAKAKAKAKKKQQQPAAAAVVYERRLQQQLGHGCHRRHRRRDRGRPRAVTGPPRTPFPAYAALGAEGPRPVHQAPVRAQGAEQVSRVGQVCSGRAGQQPAQLQRPVRQVRVQPDPLTSTPALTAA